jgi:BarA-like signal transduction histidine kinase
MFFSAEGGKVTSNDETQRLGPPARVAADVLNQHPVEVLALEETLHASNKSQQQFWVKWIDRCKAANLPDYIIILAPSKELVEEDGLQSKPWH